MARVHSFSPIGLAFAVLAALLIQIIPAAPVDAAEPSDLIFPVVGPNYYSDTFGACRGSGCSRTHQGIDIMSPKMTPVVAADDGVVKYVNFSWTEAGIDPSRCCTMVIEHTDGFQSWYLHMNNDTPGTDDGLGWGIAPGIVPGAAVYKGQLIGWVGDSGNAEGTAPHIQFEYHDPNGTVLNPMPYLDGAQVISAPIEQLAFTVDFSNFSPVINPNVSQLSISTASDAAWNIDVSQRYGSTYFTRSGTGSGLVSWDGGISPSGPYLATVDFGELGASSSWIQIGDYEWPFVDDEGSFATAEIAEMFDRGFTEGCDWNRFCPDDTLTRAQLMTMIARSVANGAAYPSYQGYYADVATGQWYTGPIEYLVNEGILPGGGDLGINYGASRALIVDVLMTAIVGPSGYGEYKGYFTDVPAEAWYRPKVELAYEMGIVNGYPDGTFRPTNTLTREEAVALLMRGL